MTNITLTIALPKTKGTHRIGTYLSQVFQQNGIEQSSSKKRQDDCNYSYSDNRGAKGFIGVHASSSDCADYLLSGLVDGAVIGLNRLADNALLNGFGENNISYIPLNVAETACKVVFATSQSYKPQSSIDVVLASHAGIARRYFNQAAIQVGKIVTYDGSLETASRVLYGTCPIVDITQTGASLEANGFVSQDTLLVSEAVLAWRNDGVLNSTKYNSFQALLSRMGLKEKTPKGLSKLHLFNA